MNLLYPFERSRGGEAISIVLYHSGERNDNHGDSVLYLHSVIKSSIGIKCKLKGKQTSIEIFTHFMNAINNFS